MKKCISFSLFGYGRERHPNSFDFLSYIRGFFINLRMARLIFPGWEIVLYVDEKTYQGFPDLWRRIPNTKVFVLPEEPLCKMMLWRMKPVFEWDQNTDTWLYSHVLCRDLDSPLTYRDAQAVQYWINRDKAIHAITDSVSHNLPLLGGMIGIRPKYFTERVAQTFDKMMEKTNIDFSKKGRDQTFLNEVIYPKFAQSGNDSITQHYFNGMPNTFLSDFNTCTCAPVAGHSDHCPNNIEIDLPAAMKESNSTCGHIGAAGSYSTAITNFLAKFRDRFEDIREVEKDYPDIFYWIKDETF